MADDANVGLLATEMEGYAPRELEPTQVGLKGGTVSGGYVLSQCGDDDDALVLYYETAKGCMAQ